MRPDVLVFIVNCSVMSIENGHQSSIVRVGFGRTGNRVRRQCNLIDHELIVFHHSLQSMISLQSENRTPTCSRNTTTPARPPGRPPLCTRRESGAMLDVRTTALKARLVQFSEELRLTLALVVQSCRRLGCSSRSSEFTPNGPALLVYCTVSNSEGCAHATPEDISLKGYGTGDVMNTRPGTRAKQPPWRLELMSVPSEGVLPKSFWAATKTDGMNRRGIFRVLQSRYANAEPCGNHTLCSSHIFWHQTGR